MKGFYYFMWFAYVMGASGALYLWWRLVKRIKARYIRDLLLGFVLFMLFTPWFATPQGVELAPALIILAHDLAFGSEGNSLRGLLPIASGFILFLLVLRPCYWIVAKKGLNSSGTSDNNLGN